MTIGPVQLLVVGFDDPDFQVELAAELERLRGNEMVRLVDGLAVIKDAEGNVERLPGTALDDRAMSSSGAVVEGLVGLGTGARATAEEGMFLTAEALEERMFDEDWDVLAEIPDGSAAALLLLEHRWAVPLREAIGRAGGERLAAKVISPMDLVAFGMVDAEEAEELVAGDNDAVV